MKRPHKIYQIHYDTRTRNENDKGFIALDNLSNPRPDWSEYWPIREYLLSHALDQDTYYGFLSPKFKQKTNLTSTELINFLGESDHDVVTFSPFFDQSAFALNVFEQAAVNHPSIHPCLEATFKLLGASIDIKTLVMTSKTTVFCNYFAAKRNVWEEWFKQCEKIFSICEENESTLATQLNSAVNHTGKPYPAKVFVIERVLSFLLATNKQWRVKAYNPMTLPYATSRIAKFKAELSELDALKIAFCETGYPEYMRKFNEIRAEILSKA
jgi:hypothetical protein